MSIFAIISESGEKYHLASPRSECFTHSHTESVGGGYYCTHDLIVDEVSMTAKMFAGGESCEFKITLIIS